MRWEQPFVKSWVISLQPSPSPSTLLTCACYPYNFSWSFFLSGWKKNSSKKFFCHGVSKTVFFEASGDVKNGPFWPCFFDSAAKSKLRTSHSKRWFFRHSPSGCALGLVPKKLIVFRPRYEITILPRSLKNSVFRGVRRCQKRSFLTLFFWLRGKK